MDIVKTLKPLLLDICVPIVQIGYDTIWFDISNNTLSNDHAKIFEYIVYHLVNSNLINKNYKAIFGHDPYNSNHLYFELGLEKPEIYNN